MAVQLEQIAEGRVAHVQVSGKLTKEDYERLVPEVEKWIAKHGEIRLLLEMHDFHGWKAGALWEDLKFAVKHFKEVDRLAIVGEKKWEEGLAVFCKPFTTAEVRFYKRDQIEEAREWVEADLPSGAKSAAGG